MSIFLMVIDNPDRVGAEEHAVFYILSEYRKRTSFAFGGLVIRAS